VPHALVTGGAGFLGSHLVEHLLTIGDRVTALDDFSAAPASNLAHLGGDLAIVEGDLFDRSVVGGIGPIDVVYHLAANASVPRSGEEPLFDARLNVLGTIAALELARERGATLLLASSAAVYGNPAYTPMDEAHPTVPISPYGQSKLAAEGYARLYRDAYGVRAHVVRYFNAYGERQRRFAVWDFANRLHEPSTELVVLGTGEQRRSLIHASDVARATRLVVDAGLPGPVNVGGRTELNVVDLAKQLQDVFGIHKPIRCTGESWPGDVYHPLPDLTQIERLGFREEVSLRDGLERFGAWYTSPARG
jgi:UDP-glucose 4-epimerase